MRDADVVSTTTRGDATANSQIAGSIAPDQPDFENFPKTEADWDRLSDDEFVRVFDSAFGPRLLDLARTHLG